MEITSTNKKFKKKHIYILYALKGINYVTKVQPNLL